MFTVIEREMNKLTFSIATCPKFVLPFCIEITHCQDEPVKLPKPVSS